MKKPLVPVLLAFCGLVAANSAWAIPLLDIVPNDASGTWGSGDALPLGGPHDVAETAGAFGWYDANLWARNDVALTFTYVGKEAGWTNALSVAGSQVFNTGSSSAGDSWSGSSASANSLIDFVIQVVSGGNSPLSVANGSNVAPVGVAGIGSYGAPNFWLGYANVERTGVYVAFDDGGGGYLGNIDDDNHDDLVFRIDAVQVPEPATLSMLLGGLFAMMLGRRGRIAFRRSAR